MAKSPGPCTELSQLSFSSRVKDVSKRTKEAGIEIICSCILLEPLNTFSNSGKSSSNHFVTVGNSGNMEYWVISHVKARLGETVYYLYSASHI